MAERAESEPVEDEGRATVGVPGLTVLGLFEALAVGVEEFLVARGVLGDPGEFLAEPFEFREILTGLAERVVQHRGDGRVGGKGHLLVQDTEVVGARDAPRVGCVDAGEHPQQGGLADAVLPDQTDAVAG